ncbi:MAG: hypothetical protein H7Y88_02385 [Phycisphaerales bacterium]|nr:hypothetical protein [Phycisphaerales bacterium]
MKAFCSAGMIGVGFLAGGTAAMGQDSRSSYLVMRANNQNGEKRYLSDTELMKALRDSLGGLYENLQVVVGACGSEGFAAEGKRLLGGSFSVATSTSYTKCEGFGTGAEVRNGKTGLALGENTWAHGWTPQYLRGIEGDADRTAAQLAQFAKDNDYKGNMGGRFEFGGTGNDAKIRDGSGGSRAMVFYTESDHRLFDPVKVDAVLKARGYTNATIDWAYSSLNPGDEAGGVPIDFGASYESLTAANGIIAGTRTYLQADTGHRKSLIVFRAHGSSEARKAPRQENPQEGAPRQGMSYTPGAGGISLIMNEDDLLTFFEEFRTDDPELDRFDGSRPMIMLTTSEEFYSGPVGVMVDGLNAGTILMNGSLNGATYSLDLSDSVWDGLFTSGALDDLLVDVEFDLPTGSFRFATEWDQSLMDLNHFGVGLVGPGILAIPAPGAAVLGVLATVGVMKRRRR